MKPFWWHKIWRFLSHDLVSRTHFHICYMFALDLQQDVTSLSIHTSAPETFPLSYFNGGVLVMTSEVLLAGLGSGGGTHMLFSSSGFKQGLSRPGSGQGSSSLTHLRSVLYNHTIKFKCTFFFELEMCYFSHVTGDKNIAESSKQTAEPRETSDWWS